MSKIILGVVFAVSSLLSSSINIEVSNILNKKGAIVIGLYNKNDATFANTSKFYKAAVVDISNRKVVYKFKNIPNGIYAIAVFHDENGNGKLDKNFLGMPKEGYGFSNNVKVKFRAATFEESKFLLNINKNINIILGY